LSPRTIARKAVESSHRLGRHRWVIERTMSWLMCAAALLITAGDNPDRMASEASFAALCGVSPIEASSGKPRRLNRGGDRRANAALYRIALTRSRGDHRTRDYLERRASQGLTRREAIRWLKRYVAREIYQLITRSTRLRLHQQLDET
jgi:transposase